jgi:hypothetical protein
MKSAFDDDSFAFEVDDQGEQRSHRPTKTAHTSGRKACARILLREKNESRIRLACLRLQLPKLMFCYDRSGSASAGARSKCSLISQIHLTEIATDQVKKFCAHQLLQEPEQLFVGLWSFDRYEVPEIHSFVLKRKRGERNVAVDPHHPLARRESFRCRFDPERRRAGSECAVEQRQRAFRKPVPEEEAIELRHSRFDAFGTFQVPRIAKV